MDLSKKQIIILVSVCVVLVIGYVIIYNFVLKDKGKDEKNNVNQSVASSASGNADDVASEESSDNKADKSNSDNSDNKDKSTDEKNADKGASKDKDATDANSEIHTETPSATRNPITAIKPKIASMVYDKEEFVVNVSNILTMTLQEDTRTDIDRAYHVEVYSSRASQDYRMISGDVTIKKNEKSAKINLKIKFTSSGDLYTLVKIYDKKGGTVILSEKSTKLRTVKYKLTSNKKLTGIDIASPLSEADCKALRKAGTDFVCRYYSTKSWKKVTRNEALAISKAGMQLAILYQDNSSNPDKFTYNEGYKQCQNAISCAIEIGQPVTTPIYFAVTYVTNDKTIKGVIDYFKGANDAMNGFKKKDSKGRYWDVAAYGSYHATESLLQKGLISKHWNIASLGGNNRNSDNYSILQTKYSVSFAGLTVDMDYSNPKRENDIGGFYVN